MKTNRKEELVSVVSNARCRLTITVLSTEGEDQYYVFHIRYRKRGQKEMKALFISLHYTDLTLAVAHARLIYELCTDILDVLYEADPQYTVQLELLRNELNYRYTEAVKTALSDPRRRSLSSAISNGDGEQLGLRLRFWENRKTRINRSSLPREVDFLWSKLDRLAFPTGN